MLKLRLKEVLNQKHITYNDLYLTTGVAQSTICRIIAGKQSPSLELLDKLATGLDVPIDELLVMDSSYIECPHCHRLIKVEVKR